MKRQDMLRSGVVRGIVSFALPLMFGNLLQQLYNTVDAVVVGRFVGKQALAAVGAAMPVYTVISFFIIGATVGVGVYLANLYGAGDREGFRKETSTALITGLGFTLIASVALLALCRPALQWMRTPEEILDDAYGYLMPLIGGLLFTFVYNFYTSGLRAVGNSVMPFCVLMFSAVLNTGLDFLFVAGLRLGVVGAGVATLIAQVAAAILIVILGYRAEPLLALKIKQIKFYKAYFKKTISYSAVTAIQQTFISLGRMLVQSAVNPLGTDTIAGYNAATRVEGFVMAPFDALSVSISTFSAQNIGAGQGKRIWRGVFWSIALNQIYALFSLGILLAFSNAVMGIFVDPSEAAVIDAGSVYLKSMAYYYFGVAFTYILQGVHRGAGNLNVVFLATSVQITIRVVLTYLLTPAYGISAVAFSSFMGWVVMIFVDFAFFYRLRRVIKKSERSLTNAPGNDIIAKTTPTSSEKEGTDEA